MVVVSILSQFVTEQVGLLNFSVMTFPGRGL